MAGGHDFALGGEQSDRHDFSGLETSAFAFTYLLHHTQQGVLCFLDEVALEQPDGLTAALAFGDSACDVGLRRRVVLASVQDDGVQCAVELAVAAAAEAVTGRLAAGGGDRCDAGESCEGGFGADPALV